MSLSAEQESDCQEAFTLFDRAGAGKLKLPEVTLVLRALGHNLAGEELTVRRPAHFLPAAPQDSGLFVLVNEGRRRVDGGAADGCFLLGVGGSEACGGQERALTR